MYAGIILILSIPAAANAQPYLCYAARRAANPHQAKFVPETVILADELEARSYDATATTTVCNPAKVDGFTPTAPTMEGYAIHLSRTDPTITRS